MIMYVYTMALRCNNLMGGVSDEDLTQCIATAVSRKKKDIDCTVF